MAKAKKETRGSTSGAAAPKAAAAKKAEAPAGKSKKAAKPATPASAPLIDTSLAAQTAANMVANRDRLAAAQSGGEKRESGAFKQLKQSFLKPAVQGPGGLLQPQGNPKKSNQGFGGRNQVGHNQTFGSDVNRAGVPRRTGGG